MCASFAAFFLLLIILVKHSFLALFKTLHTTSGVLYQEASGYNIVIWRSVNFELSSWSLQRK